jgi:hypothetical protein
MTTQEYEKYKIKTLTYLNRRLKECFSFLEKQPNNRLMLLRYENLSKKLSEVENYKI